MNRVFTGSARTRMRVGFAAFYGSNTRHKFDYSPRPPVTHRISGVFARATSGTSAARRAEQIAL